MSLKYSLGFTWYCDLKVTNLCVKEIVSDSNNIFLWHESEDILISKQRRYFNVETKNKIYFQKKTF